MKVAYIIGTYPSLTTTFIDREIRTLRKLGLQIKILSIRMPSSKILHLDQYDGLRESILYLIPTSWFTFITAHLYFVVFTPLVYFSLLGTLFFGPHPSIYLRIKTFLHFAEGVYAAYLLRGERCDHVHAHFLDRASLVALCVSKFLNRPYSLTAHANDIYVKPMLVEKKIVESKFTVTVSEFNKEHLINTYPTIDAEKIKVLHPWVDTGNFLPSLKKNKNEVLRILSVGRLVEKKGHQYLIDACHFLQQENLNFECYIIGEGPLRSELEERVIDYGLSKNVRFLGGLPQPEVLMQLDQADLFVLACTIAKDGDRDGMPVALAEAMAMELPVISTDILGLNELVKPDAGLLVPPNNPKVLAKAVQEIAGADVAVRRSMGKAGRNIVIKEFDVNNGIRRLSIFFKT